jgi:hypothetical protein
MKKPTRPKIFTPVRPYDEIAGWAIDIGENLVFAELQDKMNETTRGSEKSSRKRGRPGRRMDIQGKANDLSVRTEYELAKALRAGIKSARPKPQQSDELLTAAEEIARRRPTMKRTAVLETAKRARQHLGRTEN